MSRSHRKQRSPFRRPWLLGVALAATLAIVGVAAFGVGRSPSTGSAASCDGVRRQTLAADPDLAPTLRTVLEGSSSDALRCVKVRAVDSATATSDVAGPSTLADLWLPDSTSWMVKARAAGADLDVVSRSVASSPVVLADSRSGSAPYSWTGALGGSGLTIGDPLTSAVSSAPIAAALAESDRSGTDPGRVTAAMVPIAQSQSASTPQRDPIRRLEQISAYGGSTVVSEQEAVNADVRGFRITVPRSGSTFLDFPLAVTAGSSDRAAATRTGRALATLLASRSARRALDGDGFRAPSGAPLAEDRGVRKVRRLSPRDPADLQEALRSYALLVLPTRALAVLDVSGSMATKAGSLTRMALTTRAADIGVRLFPATSELGLWSFSTRLARSRDYRELVPIRPLGGGDAEQRRTLRSRIAALRPTPNGGTGLYDTTLAAFRAVRRDYDPKAINSVILLTDGQNDDPGSISLSRLVSTIKREQRPTRPVVIITIGITDDADSAVLKRIADASGGSSYVAKDPRDIPQVFAEALQSRTD